MLWQAIQSLWTKYLWECLDLYGRVEGTRKAFFTLYVVEGLVILFLFLLSIYIALFIVKCLLNYLDRSKGKDRNS